MPIRERSVFLSIIFDCAAGGGKTWVLDRLGKDFNQEEISSRGQDRPVEGPAG